MILLFTSTTLLVILLIMLTSLSLKFRLHVVLQKPVYAYLFLNVKKILIIYHYNI